MLTTTRSQVAPNYEFLDVKPITFRQMETLWEIKITRSADNFFEATLALAGSSNYPNQVIYALLEGVMPTAAWRSFRRLKRGELAKAAGLSASAISFMDRGLNSGTSASSRNKIAKVLAIPSDALIPIF